MAGKVRTSIRQSIHERYDDETFWFMDGYDEAIIGVDTNSHRIIYSYNKIIEKLMEDMDQDDAIQFYEYNIQSTFIDEKQPIIMEDDYEPQRIKPERRKKKE